MRTHLTKEEIQNIEDIINYTFKNKQILQTAFTRKSFAEENNVESNERLEYIGDFVLSFIINKNNAKDPTLTADDMTQLEQKTISNNNLAKSITILDISKYLIVNKPDIGNNIYENNNAKADLFEAIIGAIAIDCNYDMDILTNTIYHMLKHIAVHTITPVTKYDIFNYILNTSTTSSAQIINELQQHKYISSVEYNLLTKTHNENGDPIWEGSIKALYNNRMYFKCILNKQFYNKKTLKEYLAHSLITQIMEEINNE